MTIHKDFNLSENMKQVRTIVGKGKDLEDIALAYEAVKNNLYPKTMTELMVLHEAAMRNTEVFLTPEDITCKRAVEMFGCRQIDKAIEELAELMQVLCKLKNVGSKEEEQLLLPDLISEISDVEIMCKQLKIMYNIEKDVIHEKKYKLQRLEEKMDQEMDRLCRSAAPGLIKIDPPDEDIQILSRENPFVIGSCSGMKKVILDNYPMYYDITNIAQGNIIARFVAQKDCEKMYLYMKHSENC